MTDLHTDETSVDQPVSDPREGQVDHHRFEQKLKVRALVSVLLFALFLVGSVICALMKQTEQYAIVLLGMFIGAVLLMPRQTLPKDFRSDASTEAFETRMLRVKNWLAITRLIFFILALASFFLLPRL